jgi:hypothetical protein
MAVCAYSAKVDMTQDEIIEMAVQAELNLYVHDLTKKQYIEVIKHFAKLVAAKRTWVGLTDEERSQLVTLHHGWNEYAQAIEAKLKEKNCVG